MVVRLSQTLLKRLGLFLTFVFLFGQFHQCLPKFQRFDGRDCVVCPTLPDADQDHHEGTIEASHGDCHDCCFATDCGDSKKASYAAFSLNAFQLDFDLPRPLLVPVFDSFDEVFGAAPAIEGHPPTGPPSRHSSRAPPFFRFA